MARKILERFAQEGSPDELASRLMPRSPDEEPLAPRLPTANDFSKEALEKRHQILSDEGISLDHLVAKDRGLSPEELAGNIENFVGFGAIPVGVIGPLRVNGMAAHGDFYVPLATSEGALVASYNRGASIISLAGGATTVCLTESVSRAPAFIFDRFGDAGRFLAYALQQYDSFQETIAATSRHCRLIDMKPSITGKELYLILEFTTGDAAGQNMVTLATNAICERLVRESPIRPVEWYLEGNLSGDKKATMLSYLYARGKKVVAEAVIPRSFIVRFIRTDPENLHRYWQVSFMGGAQSGSIGVQGHFANGLAALFIACGQDAACISEASVGMTRMDVTGDGDLYVSVTLPNLIVGTVGGGTWLPTARECLEMIDCHGAGKSQKFAEICAGTVLAGELSIIGALAGSYFAHAHATYGRNPDRR
jgi:hydroxymethylglutaryl-CoA reductase (NADPH)